MAVLVVLLAAVVAAAREAAPRSTWVAVAVGVVAGVVAIAIVVVTAVVALAGMVVCKGLETSISEDVEVNVLVVVVFINRVSFVFPVAGMIVVTAASVVEATMAEDRFALAGLAATWAVPLLSAAVLELHSSPPTCMLVPIS